MSTPKPQNEIVLAFAKDHQDLVIVTLFDVHGEAMKASVAEAGFDGTKFAGKEAIKRTGVIGGLVKKLGLVRKQFSANGHQYWSYTLPA